MLIMEAAVRRQNQTVETDRDYGFGGNMTNIRYEDVTKTLWKPENVRKTLWRRYEDVMKMVRTAALRSSNRANGAGDAESKALWKQKRNDHGNPATPGSAAPG